jgi:hypothetical protein
VNGYPAIIKASDKILLAECHSDEVLRPKNLLPERMTLVVKTVSLMNSRTIIVNMVLLSIFKLPV